MRILLIGNGAREHAIAMAIKSSKHNPELVVIGKAKNPGIIGLAAEYIVGNIEDLDFIKSSAQTLNPDYAIIGPDNQIGIGAADVLEDLGIPTFAPLKTVARLESSKGFTRELVKKYNIPGNPEFKIFTKENFTEINAYVASLDNEFVVKYDGLFGGKGVQVSGEHFMTPEQGLAFASECLQNSEQVVIEQKIVGPEFSLMFFADGKSLIRMPAVQDHKRAYEGDTGPNTGGMGTYSDADLSLPFLNEQDLSDAEEITKQVMHALKTETGVDFRGIMYGGFMKTKFGVKLIEYNARFGDPEAMNVLSLLESDFVDLMLASFQQDLASYKVQFKKQATVCIYIVPAGYPDTPIQNEQDKIITVKKSKTNSTVFFASVDLISESETEYVLRMSASRSIALVGTGDTIEQALLNAKSGITNISGKIHYRSDIGTKELIQKRIDQVNQF